MMTNYFNLDKLLTIYRLILASGSPRRVKILTDAGIKFEQIIPDVDETFDRTIEPSEMAMKLAERKASAVQDTLTEDQVALGCDTIVVIENELLTKPKSRDDALKMLTRLSGNCHTVCTAVSLMTINGNSATGYDLTKVFFNDIKRNQLLEYIDSGEPMDKAGAYGIQGAGGFLVDRIEGNLDNVIGLPMKLLDDLAGRLMKK